MKFSLATKTFSTLPSSTPIAQLGVVWFKGTDLRTSDHAPLYHAHKECSEVLHAYVIDPSQYLKVHSESDSCKCSMKRLKFLSETLIDLNQNLQKVGSKLHIFTGPTDKIMADVMDGLFQAVETLPPPSTSSSSSLPRLYYHDEFIHEEKQYLSSSLSMIRGKYPLSSYWGGGTIYEASDLPFSLDKLNMYTNFRKSMEGKDRSNPQIPMRDPLPGFSFKPSPQFDAIEGQDSTIFTGIGGAASSDVPYVLIPETEMTVSGILQKLVDCARSIPDTSLDPFFEVGDAHVSGGEFRPFIGGETVGRERISHYIDNGVGRLSVYKETRNGMAGMDYSSKLSPWLAVGAITARQIVKSVKDFEKSSGISNDSTYWLIFELLWRDYMKFYGLRQD